MGWGGWVWKHGGWSLCQNQAGSPKQRADKQGKNPPTKNGKGVAKEREHGQCFARTKNVGDYERKGGRFAKKETKNHSKKKPDNLAQLVRRGDWWARGKKIDAFYLWVRETRSGV